MPLSLCLLREFAVHSQLSFPWRDQERVKSARDQEALEEGGEEGAVSYSCQGKLLARLSSASFLVLGTKHVLL